MKKTILLLLLSLSVISVRAQLAITEAMSSAANTYTTNGVTNAISAASDYWELTNFGTNDISLQDYLMADDGAGLGGAQSSMFESLTIHAGESILFVRDDGTTATTNAAAVQNWWGTNLNPSVVIRFYAPFGFSSTGDGVSVWDPASNLVDSVIFGAATRGRAFTYNTNTGLFAVLSTAGEGNAFQSETSDDVGSPGITAGPVPLTISQQPTNFTVVSGNTAVFGVVARGLPRPKYQWYFTNTLNVGGPLAGQILSSLTLPGALTNNAGTYTVVVDNGVQTATSSTVTLTVNAAPTPPSITAISPGVVAYVGQSTTFFVQAQGNPVPTYQWKLNGTNLPVTTTNLTLASLQVSDSGTYSVEVSNGALPNATASITLLVTPRPALVVTEVQSSQASGTNIVADWWELSNLDTFSVDLFGYRWDDNSANLGVAYTFTNHTIIKPGESIICVENLAADQFRAWWGVSNLPANLQIVNYVANGVGLGASGDQVNLWNQAATVNSDPIGKIAFISLSSATAGRTFVRNPDTGVFSGNTTTGLSTNGVNGAFVAAQFGDIGSPGWVVEPMTLHLTPNGGGFDLTWNSTAGRTYTIFYKNSVADTNWSTLTSITATGTTTTITESTAPASRIYRLGVTVH